MPITHINSEFSNIQPKDSLEFTNILSILTIKNDTTIIDIYIDYRELKHNDVHDPLKALL